MQLINLQESPVRHVLRELLQDKTTKQNIMFATNAYSDSGITPRTPITVELLLGMDSLALQPRVLKSLEEQSQRTRNKAEVFTPSWICNKMNNNCDNVWFGKENVFNTETEQGWITAIGKIEFPKRKRWQRYVDSKRLEITCGEAPYLVSRYDTTTGEIISIGDRIGILDRKLQLFEDQPIRTAWNEEEEEWYFAIVDVVGVLAESKDHATYWRKLKQRLREEGNDTVTNCHGLKLKAADGKRRLTDVANTEQSLSRILCKPPK